MKPGVARQTDEILEKIQQGRVMTGPHDFDGIQAVGDWIVCERVSSVAKTRGGIVVPEQAQMPIWTILSIGENVNKKVGRELHPGDRVMFQNPEATLVHDGRGFAFITHQHLVAILAMPPSEPVLTIATAGLVQQ